MFHFFSISGADKRYRSQRSFRTRDMLQPSLADFDFWSEGAEIVVVFRPTETHFAFPLLAGGEMSAAPKIRHAQTSDTGRYGGNEVLELAYHLGRQYLLLNR